MITFTLIDKWPYGFSPLGLWICDLVDEQTGDVLSFVMPVGYHGVWYGWYPICINY